MVYRPPKNVGKAMERAYANWQDALLHAEAEDKAGRHGIAKIYRKKAAGHKATYTRLSKQ